LTKQILDKTMTSHDDPSWATQWSMNCLDRYLVVSDQLQLCWLSTWPLLTCYYFLWRRLRSHWSWTCTYSQLAKE